MSEKEINELEKLNENPILLEAIKKILSEEFELEFELTEIDNELSNEILGEITRACMQGRLRLDKGFKVIERYKKVDSKLETENIAI